MTRILNPSIGYDPELPTKNYEGKKYAIVNPYKNGGSLHLKGQLHCHTTNSDGADTASALVTAYKNAGYDFITITDHDYLTPDPEVAGITWLGVGVEETNNLHITAYDVDSQSTYTNSQDVINYHRANGKLANLSHPIVYLSGIHTLTKDELEILYNLNSLEVYNSTVEPAEDQWDWALSSGKKIFGLGVDDCHDISGANFNKSWVVVHTDTNSKAAILQSIRDGNFYASSGNDITISVSGNIVTASSVGSSNFVFYGRNGRVLKTENTVTSSNYTILGDEMYVRVKSTLVADSTLAYSQPVFVDILGDDGEGLARIREPSFNNFMARQAIINGNFNVWQRGVSFANPINTLYMADRWRNLLVLDGGTNPTVTITREALISGDIPNAFYFIRVAVNGAGSSYGSNSGNAVLQKIENGTRFLCGNGKKFTVSFWAKSDIAGKKLGLYALQAYGAGGSPTTAETLTGTTFNLTSSWVKYTFTFTTNTLAGKTFGTANDDTVEIRLFQQWGNGVYGTAMGGASAETFVGSGNIDIAQVQLCAGDVALPFMPKSEAQEKLDCQRFRWDAVVRTINGIMYYSFPTTMRTTPTTLTASAGTIANGTKDGFQITHNANADSTIVADIEL